MGLNVSHDCWRGSYMAFTRWRTKLAEVAGYAFFKEGIHDQVMIDWGHIPPRCILGNWDDVAPPNDPLIYLIAHSDCEGEIRPAQAGPLADAIEKLIPLLPDEVGGGHIGNWRIQTKKFVDGLRRAVAAGEVVEFS